MTQALRNIAFVGHPASGKTALVDAFAWKLGASPRKGSTADKSSICDTEPEEQEKGHTLQLAAVYAERDGLSWNLLDTPGYPEFVSDVLASMYAAELVVGVVSCASGTTFNFRKKMEEAQGMGRARAVIVTHLDAENADFEAVLQALRASLGEACVPVFLPDASGPAFSAVTPILGGAGSDWKKILMDRVMDACEDESVLERYLETEALSDEELHENLTHAMAAGTVVPVLPCNPIDDTGLEQAIGFLAEYAPQPSSYPPPQVDGQAIALDPAGPLHGVVFAVRSDPHVGKLVFAKILRGTLGAHDAVAGPGSEKGEKLGGLFHSVGKKKRDTAESAGPGEIAVFSKVEGLTFGQSFSHPGEPHPQVAVPEMPLPMVSLAVEPKSRADEQKIGESLHKLAAEDPCFKVEFTELHELVMRGMSDLHLQVMEARLKRRYGVEITTHLPRIDYRETISRPADGHHRHKKQSGGRGQFGECYIRVRPLEKGAGFVFSDKVVGGSIPRNLIPAVEKGMREVTAKGILAGGKVVDLEAELYDGKFHAVDSDEASFKMAGSRALADAFQKAGPTLLEPIMELQISIPTEDAGTVFSDITSQRRGHVLDQWTEQDGAVTVVKARAPLATVQTYFRDLKSQTAGEGSYTMTFADYAVVPAQEQQKILAAHAKEKAEE